MTDDQIVYVHIPFCSSKCHFCYWTSPIPTSELVHKHRHSNEYRSALIQQIDSYARAQRKQPQMRLIYFGGGTPSLMEASDLKAILDSIFTHFTPSALFKDVTIEIAPETVDLEKLCALRNAGFSRVSFGFQSLDEHRVKLIGRAHTANQAVAAFRMARQAGFDNINIDLMLGFPDESDEEWKRSFSRAVELEPEHISVYVYKQVPGTVMAQQIDRGLTTPTPADESVRRYMECSTRLVELGYTEYMFQLFSRDTRHCYCDEAYFHLDADYVGFGAGSHSLLSGHLLGHANNLTAYLAKPAFQYRIPIAHSPDALIRKLIEMLHTKGGINPQRFEERFRIGLDTARDRHPSIDALFRDLETAGAVIQTDGRYTFRDRESSIRWLAPAPKKYAQGAIAPHDLVSVESLQ